MASQSFTYSISIVECAALYNDVLGTLEDMFSAHVGSVADGGEGKKRELGCNKPYSATRFKSLRRTEDAKIEKGFEFLSRFGFATCYRNVFLQDAQ